VEQGNIKSMRIIIYLPLLAFFGFLSLVFTVLLLLWSFSLLLLFSLYYRSLLFFLTFCLFSFVHLFHWSSVLLLLSIFRFFLYSIKIRNLFLEPSDTKNTDKNGKWNFFLGNLFPKYEELVPYYEVNYFSPFSRENSPSCKTFPRYEERIPRFTHY